MRRPLFLALLLASVLVLSLGGIGFAHPPDDGVLDSAKEEHGDVHDQHGGEDGHLPASNDNVDLVSKLELTTIEGRIADVGVWNGFAYLAAFATDACAGPEGGDPDGGVWVVDIRDPENPQQIGFIPIHQDSFVGEGVQALTVTTSKFDGDLLVMNAESCGKNDKGGFTLVDVTDPFHPKKLVSHYGDFNPGGPGRDANDIHSAFVWDAGDKAYVVVVDDFESTDVDIFDITNPKKPKFIAEYDLDALFPEIIDPTLGEVDGFLHDMIVREIDGRQIMLLSYWDSGYVLLDVTDPTDVTYLADSDYINPDPLAEEFGFPGREPAGNGHQAEFTLDDQFIIATDEDFNPFSALGFNVSDGTEFEATSGSDTPQLEDGESIEGPTVFGGLACPGDPPVPPGDPAIVDFALIERGVCTFTEKVAAVEAAGGYDAAIVFNRTGSDACSALVSMSVEGNIPAFFVNRPTGLDFLDVAGYDEAECLAGGSPALPEIGTEGDTVRLTGQFNGWGYVHLFRNDLDPDDGDNKLEDLDQYAIPEAFDPDFASGFGALSVHEVATSHQQAGLGYLAYYAGGFRVIQIVDEELVEVGHFIDEGGNNFWGVQVFEHEGQELVAASDRDFGLYIFEYNPDA
jgi:hypothetical protein